MQAAQHEHREPCQLHEQSVEASTHAYIKLMNKETPAQRKREIQAQARLECSSETALEALLFIDK